MSRGDPRHLTDLRRRLEESLSRGAPGSRAQLDMAPSPRPGWTPGLVPESARAAAALALLYEDSAGESSLVLTVRSASMPSHAGQVSLPGGALHDGESAEEAAHREAQEEIGVARGAIETIGTLTPLYVPVSNFAIEPFVALHSGPARFTPSHEVAEVLETPVAALLDPSIRGSEIRRWRKKDVTVPYYEIGGHRVWGATAMILAELVHAIEKALSSPGD